MRRAAVIALLIAVLGAGACSGRRDDSAPLQSTALPSSAASVADASPPDAAAEPPRDADVEPPGAAVNEPRPERPSTRTALPKGVDATRWRSVFDLYGHLLDIDYLLDDYHRRYPGITEVVTLGTTHEGRAVRALLIADRPAEAGRRPAVLLNGAHHGDEPLSGEVVLDAIEALLARASSDPKPKRYLAELSIWCVPVVNPDGLAAFFRDFEAGRKNGRETRKQPSDDKLKARGVDINRNYPFRWGALGERGSRSDPLAQWFRGPEAKSEPETTAMVALSDREHFVASISYHIGTVALLAPYTIDGVASPSPDEAWRVAEEIAAKIPLQNGSLVPVRRNIYPVDGTDQDYHRFAHGTVALLFEASRRSWESAPLVRRSLDGLRPSWGALFDRYLDGPSVEGHVRDAAGRPISADVRVAEVVTRSGEVWRSRASDGFFGRFLPGFGRYTLRVFAEGAAPVEQVVEVSPGSGRARVEVEVVPSDGHK